MIYPDRTVRLLYVEDDPEAARLFARRLGWFRAVRFEVEQASDLQTALACLANEAYDAVLLDLSLPDGEAMSTLAAAGALARRVPIIVLTGNDDADTALLAARLGVQDYLCKNDQDGLSVGHAVLEAIERHRWVRGATA